MLNEKQKEHAEKLARIESRKQAFARSPFWFTLWDISGSVLNIVFWLAFWSLITQCSCDCIW